MAPVSVGFIGTGNMGGAIITGITTCFEAEHIKVSAFDIDKEVLTRLKKQCKAVAICDTPPVTAQYLFLAVKPHYMEQVCREIAPELTDRTVLISIAAGIRSATLAHWTDKKCPVVRVMPNTPAMAGRGIFALNLEDSTLSAQQKEFLTALFDQLGQVHVLPETLFDAFTAIAGSGPAYVFFFMEAIIEAGVTLGLTRQQTTAITKELFAGSAALAQKEDTHVCLLREMVSSPAGTTIRATNHFDAKALRATIVQAIIKSCERSQELGK